MSTVTVVAEIECMPWLAEILPEEAAILIPTETRNTTDTRKIGIRASGNPANQQNILTLHSAALTKKMREITSRERIPFSEFGASLDIALVGCEGPNVVMLDVDDIDEKREVVITFIKTSAKEWISCDAMLIFTLHCTAFNEEGEEVNLYVGSACLPLQYALRGKTMELDIIDVYDPPSKDDMPDFLLPGGCGYKKGTLIVKFPPSKFGLQYDDFAKHATMQFNRSEYETAMDEVILASLQHYFDVTDDITMYKVRKPAPPAIKGIEPMQAPVHRTSLTKLPGGTWALLERNSPTPDALWCEFLRCAISRYTTMPASYDTPLWHSPIDKAEHWLIETINNQFKVWGPKQKRVHPHFHLACMIVFHACCVFAVSLYYINDHTSEEGPGKKTKFDQNKVRSIDNRRFGEQDLTGDCDTFSAVIIRFIYELQTYDTKGISSVNAILIESAKQVVRLYECGMPHGAVSAKNVLVAKADDLQNHMFAWAFPRRAFYVSLKDSIVSDKDLMMQMTPYYGLIDKAETVFDTRDKNYSGMPWQDMLMPMILEGTGPLNPFPVATYLSACSWLFAEDPKTIPANEIKNDIERAKEIAQREILALELEGLLMEKLDFAKTRLGTCMMLFDYPDASLLEIYKAQETHFYKYMTGFQIGSLARAGIPVVDMYFCTGTQNSERPGLSIANMAFFSFFWRNKGQGVPASKRPRVKPALVIKPDHMKKIMHALSLEPKPYPPQNTPLTKEEYQVGKELVARDSKEDLVEVTFYVRINHLKQIIELVNHMDANIVKKCQVSVRNLGASSMNPNMKVIVGDVTIALAYPGKEIVNEKIPIEPDVNKQIAEMKTMIYGN